MVLLRLVSWNPQACASRKRELEKAGFKVVAGPAPAKQMMTHFRDLAPGAIVIDLDTLPSHGRAVGVMLRTTKSTRRFPLVFAGGESRKTQRARSEMPDACFTDWKKAAASIKRFLREAPTDPIVPPAYMDQVAGSSLIKKLGFKAGMRVAIIGAPEGFEEQLGELPEAVAMGERIARATGMALWFVRSRGELEGEIEFMSARLPEGCSLWIIHPKQTSRMRADFNQNDVRNRALAVGLVDYKVCSVDSDWSGLKFTRKKG
jgi:Protein of unknown function (DUF3052)